MLVQDGADALRLIRQQDHAQLAGALAHAWRGPSGGAAGDDAGAGGDLPYRLVWTTGVHDAAWTELDRTPVLDTGTGRPHDFRRLPLDRKLGPYREGIRRIGELDAYAGYQVSRHYCSFLDPEESASFLEAERDRRERLRRRLPPGLRRGSLLDRELAYLKLFDTLSLYLCLASPDGGSSGGCPDWLVPGDRVETPEGTSVDLRWRTAESLVLDPYPFSGELELAVPYRRVRGRFDDQAALTRRWREAEVRHRAVRVLGEDGGGPGGARR